MGITPSDIRDPGLTSFIRELVEDDCLTPEAEAIGRLALERGLEALSTEQRRHLDEELIEPYSGSCETCGITPPWDQMLHVYDTGLCASCFDKLEGIDDLGVRPEWMPLVMLPDEDELPVDHSEPTGQCDSQDPR